MSHRVLSFESRRQTEMRALLEKQQLQATVAASMRELPLEMSPAIREFFDQLRQHRVHLVLFMTGVGAEALMTLAEQQMARSELLSLLERTCVIVRGPKPTSVLRQWPLRIDHKVAEPNTWREVLELLDAEIDVSGRVIAVQEYGVPNLRLYDALAARGATVLRVPVYRWGLPEDPSELHFAIHAAVERPYDAVIFTSANQIVNVLGQAEQLGLRDSLVQSLDSSLIVSIGPTCSEALEDHGFRIGLEASPPKMGHLVRQLAERLGGQRG